MHAPTPATLLQLMWLASPALPVGGFSYSEGLEAAVEAGIVGNEAQAGDWLLGQLQLSLARSDLPALAQACAAWQVHDTVRIAQLNDWLRQTRETAELRAQAEQMGRSLLDWLRNGVHGGAGGAGGTGGTGGTGGPSADDRGDPRIASLAALRPAPLWPTSFALAAVLAGATAHDAVLAFAWSWAENMAQAAMKAVPLGQAAAQRVLASIAAAIPDVVTGALLLPDDARQAFTPMLAILSAQHESQYSRCSGRERRQSRPTAVRLGGGTRCCASRAAVTAPPAPLR